MNERIKALINSLSEEGNAFIESENYSKAILVFEKALDLIPEPIEDSSMATWLLVAIGDSYFLQENYLKSLKYMNHAVACRDGLGNPFIHFRLGQLNYELENYERAKDELIRVYMLGEMELFRNADVKYFDFLRSNVDLRER